MFAGIKFCKLEEFHKHSANIFTTYVSENVSYWPASVMLQACGTLFSSESVLEALCEVSKKVTSPSGTWLGTETVKVDIRTYLSRRGSYSYRVLLGSAPLLYTAKMIGILVVTACLPKNKYL